MVFEPCVWIWMVPKLFIVSAPFYLFCFKEPHSLPSYIKILCLSPSFHMCIYQKYSKLFDTWGMWIGVYRWVFFFFFFVIIFKLQRSFLWLIDPLVFNVHFYVLMKLLSSFFCCSVAKHLESANTMFSFIWWIIGFYWVNAGGQQLTEDAPQLYWLVQWHLVDAAKFFCNLFSWSLLNTFSCVQALHYIFGIWCILCCYMCCCCMHCWNCSLLLSTLYHCNFICGSRPGIALCKFSGSSIEWCVTFHDLHYFLHSCLVKSFSVLILGIGHRDVDTLGT